MDSRRLERWAIVATIALYVASAASLVIIPGESLLAEGSPEQPGFRALADYLNRLGEIGGGAVIVAMLFILIGGGTGMLLLKAYDQLQENRKRPAREREAALAQGRAEGRFALLEELRNLGINVDDLLPSEDADSGPPGTD